MKHQVRQRSPTPTPDQGADRKHILLMNLREIQTAALKAPRHVIVVIDSRDPIGREWIKAAGKLTEADLRAKEAAFIRGSTIPTFFLAVPRPAAIELTQTYAPASSEALAALPEDESAVLVIAAGGHGHDYACEVGAAVGRRGALRIRLVFPDASSVLRPEIDREDTYAACVV